MFASYIHHHNNQSVEEEIVHRMQFTIDAYFILHAGSFVEDELELVEGCCCADDLCRHACETPRWGKSAPIMTSIGCSFTHPHLTGWFRTSQSRRPQPRRFTRSTAPRYPVHRAIHGSQCTGHSNTAIARSARVATTLCHRNNF